MKGGCAPFRPRFEIDVGTIAANDLVRVPGSGSPCIKGRRDGLLLGPDGEQVPLPEEVYGVLVEVVEAMRECKVITLVPRTRRLATQEVANFLGISRPTLVKLLEDGKILYDQPGRHRRILFTDLLAYTGRQHAERRAALDRMAEDGSKAGSAQIAQASCEGR
jgi:excisionase family DNA binding protein